MASRPITTSRLDRVAMGLSGLCAVHCVATAVLLGLLASAGGCSASRSSTKWASRWRWSSAPFALGRGIREHGFLLPSAVGIAGLGIMGYAMSLHETGFEPVFTILGVAVLALGHRLNMMAKHAAY